MYDRKGNDMIVIAENKLAECDLQKAEFILIKEVHETFQNLYTPFKIYTLYWSLKEFPFFSESYIMNDQMKEDYGYIFIPEFVFLKHK